VHHIVDGEAKGVALRGVYPARDRPVEPQSGQMRLYGCVDYVGSRVVLARNVEHRRNVDTRDVRFSHTGYDVGETR
jgi:hypothetical protein